MKISIYLNEGDLHTTNGYGNSGFNIIKSLQNLGHQVPFNDDEAPVQINFCWPTWFKDMIRPGQYTIGYTPWESTELPDEWLEIFNVCDEVWTTSEWVKNVYEQAGVTVPLKVYQHGVRPDWKPFKRTPNNVLRFLHQGEPAPRKNGQLAYDAFKAAFPGKTDVSLTLKTSSSSLITVRTGSGITFGPPGQKESDNVRVVKDIVTYEELIGLYHSHHAMVYPSAGEGFGLMPLQALATGMPTICTSEWAPYKKYLGNLGLNSEYVVSPWQKMHPGKVLKVDFDDLVDKYRYLYNNYTEESNTFFKNSFSVHEDYNWENLTKTAVQGLERKLEHVK